MPTPGYIENVLIHDAHRAEPSYASALSRLVGLDARYAPMGVFRDVSRPVYDTMMSEQLERASATAPADDDALQSLLLGSDTWTI